MRPLAPLLIALALLWVGPAFADSDNSNKDHEKHESNAGGNGNANGDGNGSANGNRNGNNSPQTEHAGSGSASSAPDQNTALDAVRDGAALPLGDIVALAHAKWGGRAIDAKLLKSRAGFVYQLTMLSDQGFSRRVYYDAASGRSVKGP